MSQTEKLTPERFPHNLRGWVLRQILFSLWLICITTVILAFSFTSGYDLQVEGVALEDIRAPHDITYVSGILSQQARENAARRVAAIYTRPDPRIARQQLNRMWDVFKFLSALRADAYASVEQKQAWVLSVEELSTLPGGSINTLLALPATNWNDVQVEARRLLDQVMRQQEIRAQDLERVKERVPALVPIDLPQDEATLVAELVQRFLVSNSFYDETATEAARQKARDEADPAFRTWRRGQVVIREGSVVTDLDIEALEYLGLTPAKGDGLDIGLIFLISTLLTGFLGLYLHHMQPELLDDARLESMFVLLLTVFLLLARLLIPSGSLLPYLFPGAAMAMILATTIGSPTAIGGAIFLSSVCGWISDRSLGVTVLVLLGSLFAVLTLPRYEQTGAIFRSGLLAGFIKGLTLLAFSAAEFALNPFSVLLNSIVCVVGGIISGGLTLGGLFLLAYPFDLATTFRLVELSSPNYPLLQRLLREAPGTFQHSTMVASIAEQAAERIGANALLTRVGGYYHDVGKLMRPYFFIENQSGLSNPHDRLDPYTSAEVVTSHVREGDKLARQYRLPARVRTFISEHHGTMQISFFYQKALQAAGGEVGLVDEVQFRYPGPKPQSRETVLLMLADSCEAATRARRPQTPEELAGIVDYIFEQRVKDGQLDDCPITMRELSMVKEAYIELLRGVFHPRIKYPDGKDSALKKAEDEQDARALSLSKSKKVEDKHE